MTSCRETYHQVIVDGNQYKLAARYRSCQSDDLIMFIHGLGCSSESFCAVWDYASLADVSILAFDLLGFGLSEKPSQFSYKMEDHARVCQAMLAQFPTKRVHIVAHSMGGVVGLVLTKSFAPTSFINVEGNLIAEDCGMFSRKTQSMSESSFIRDGFAPLKQSLSVYPKNYFDLDNAMPEAFHRSARSQVEWSDSGALLDLFYNLTVPKTYIYGEKNTDMAVLQRIDSRIKTIRIPNSAHFPMIENSDGFYSVLADLVKVNPH